MEEYERLASDVSAYSRVALYLLKSTSIAPRMDSPHYALVEFKAD